MRLADAPWELWAILLSIVGIAAVPIMVGWLVFKLFRTFKPIEVSTERRIGDFGESNRDGFFRILFVGWLICAPVFYWLYHWFYPIN